MVRLAIAGFFIGSPWIWLLMLTWFLIPSAFIFGGQTPTLLALITIFPIMGGIIGWLFLGRKLESFIFGTVLSPVLNSIPLLVSYIIYHNTWALAIDYGYITPPLISGLIGAIVTPYLYKNC